MIVKINRYSFSKELLEEGQLVVSNSGSDTTLAYKDKEIDISITAPYHPIKALEDLRLKLENEHQSFLNCNGCRVDTSYRTTGGYGTWLNEIGKQAEVRLNLFEPTEQIDQLDTVKTHKNRYKTWLNSLK